MANRERVSPAVPEPAPPGYEDDFYAWTQSTAARLREGRLSDVDVARVAEEIEDMGKRDRRELDSRMQVLLVHLLKWQLQPDRRSPSWKASVVAQRAGIAALLRDSPSLKPRVAGELARNYAIAVERVAAETGLGGDAFPATCPWPPSQLLEKSFLPVTRRG
jgi:hypothetical protein